MPCKGQEEESQTIIQLEIGFLSFLVFSSCGYIKYKSINVPKAPMIFNRWVIPTRNWNVFRQSFTVEIDSTGKEHKIPWHNNQQNSFFPPADFSPETSSYTHRS